MTASVVRGVVPAQSGDRCDIVASGLWMPAFAGMTASESGVNQ